jgi:hypothetical protein
MARILPELTTLFEGKMKDMLNRTFKEKLPDAGVNIE